MTRVARKAERDRKIMERVKAGATADQVAHEFGLIPNTAEKLWRSMARSLGIELPPKAGTRKPDRIDRTYGAALAECERHLGRQFVADYLGPVVGAYDDGQVLMVQRLHAALRCELLDAAPSQRVVRERMRELRRAALDEAINTTRSDA